jgi:hypothetical protein
MPHGEMQVVLIVVMAQMGSNVPASSARLTPVDNILVYAIHKLLVVAAAQCVTGARV